MDESYSQRHQLRPESGETKGIGYHIDASLHFRWKSEKIVSQDCYELYEGIELIADKIQSVAKKEKEKVMNI